MKIRVFVKKAYKVIGDKYPTIRFSEMINPDSEKYFQAIAGDGLIILIPEKKIKEFEENFVDKNIDIEYYG